MNVFLLVLGMIMDGFSALLVAIPLVLPFAAHFGLGPFHVAIMFVLNLELAFSCPPLGLNLFISSFRFNRPVVSLYKLAMPFVGLLAVALLVITYVPHISNMLVLDDIANWRTKAEKDGRTPREAWRLECVQFDNSNPLPCSPEEKIKYPNGRMPEPSEDAARVKVQADAGAPQSEEDAIDALIAGKEAGAPKPSSTTQSEDDIDDLIMGKGKDAGAASDAPKKPTLTGKESDDDIDNLIMGKGRDGG
jgi:C4-dicarboxylate transporter DctM subunit